MHPKNSRHRHMRAPLLLTLAVLLCPSSAHASMFHGETLDSIAGGISWVAIVLAPIIGIALFWLVHILPEKIAHKRKHPQTQLVQCLCLMSLVFGEKKGLAKELMTAADKNKDGKLSFEEIKAYYASKAGPAR